MSFLDGKGLQQFVKLLKPYIGIPWSMSGDTNDTLVLINDNLDNYTTIGNYYCRPDTDAKTVSNNPAGASFILKVYSGAGYSYETSGGNYLTQHLEDLYGNIWIRYKTTGSWSAWNMIFTVTGDSTIGSSTNPIYLKNGTFIASSSTVGSGTKPIYLNNGDFTVSSFTVGGTAQPMYLNSGTFTALSSTIGSDTQPIYLSSGKFTASSSTVGSESSPVYLKSGVLTVCSNLGSNGKVTDYQFGETGYVRYDFGLIIQWGKTSDNPITYPIAFTSSTSYAIMKNGLLSTLRNTTDAVVSFYSRTETSAKTTYSTRTNNDDTGLQWLAIGY